MGFEYKQHMNNEEETREEAIKECEELIRAIRSGHMFLFTYAYGSTEPRTPIKSTSLIGCNSSIQRVTSMSIAYLESSSSVLDEVRKKIEARGN